MNKYCSFIIIGLSLSLLFVSCTKKPLTLDENTSRISEKIYGLPVNGLQELKVSQVNDVFQRLDKIEEVWKPVLLDENLSKDIK